MLMVGVEVRRYALEAKVAELARRLALPVVTSFMGRGLLVDTGAALRGSYLGLAGDPRLSAEVEESDALVLLGVIVSDTNFAVSARRIDMRHAIQGARRSSRDGAPRLSRNAAGCVRRRVARACARVGPPAARGGRRIESRRR